MLFIQPTDRQLFVITLVKHFLQVFPQNFSRRVSCLDCRWEKHRIWAPSKDFLLGLVVESGWAVPELWHASYGATPWWSWLFVSGRCHVGRPSHDPYSTLQRKGGGCSQKCHNTWLWSPAHCWSPFFCVWIHSFCAFFVQYSSTIDVSYLIDILYLVGRNYQVFAYNARVMMELQHD